MTVKGMILALDASTTAVGWCLADGAEYVDGGVYKPKRRADIWERMQQIKEWLCLMLGQGHVKLVAYEEPVPNRGNMKTNRNLGALMGIAFTVAGDNGAQFLRVHPMKVKATGLCKDSRRIVAAYVGKEEVGGDEADAVGVWMAALEMMRETKYADKT